jgi:hypothetical protein
VWYRKYTINFNNMKKIVCYIREKSNLLVAIPINMLLATVGLIPFLAAAQSSPAYTIQGAVRTTTDAPVVGATIVLEGTQFGTTSDVTGTFTLDLKQKPSQGSALSVSCIGYKTKRIPLTESNAAISVVLEEDNNLLDEVVVIGYGSVQKKDLTGSLSSIDGGAILNRQTQTVSMALQGAMPGVTVTRTNSAPGQEDARRHDPLAAETVADKSSDRDQHGIEQVENRGDRTDGHIAQPQVLADERKHHVEYLSVRLIEQVGDPQQGQHLPFVSFTDFVVSCHKLETLLSRFGK